MGVDQCFKSFCDHQINMFIPFTFEYLNPDHLQKKIQFNIKKPFCKKGQVHLTLEQRVPFILKDLGKELYSWS